MAGIIRHRKSEGKPARRVSLRLGVAMRLKLEQVLVSAAVALSLALVGCGKHEQRFESTCQLVRRDVVETDEKGEPEIMDVELEWDPCPGDQFQVVRGGKEFAKCIAQYEVGKLLPVLVKHWWDDRGYYVWDVYKIGDCDARNRARRRRLVREIARVQRRHGVRSQQRLFLQSPAVQGPSLDLPVDGPAVTA